MRSAFTRSPKSKEGCKGTNKQKDKLTRIMMLLLDSNNAVKNYTMIKRLILLNP